MAETKAPRKKPVQKIDKSVHDKYVKEKEQEIKDLKEQLEEFTKGDELYVVVAKLKSGRIVTLQGGYVSSDKKEIENIAKRLKGEVRRIIKHD